MSSLTFQLGQAGAVFIAQEEDFMKDVIYKGNSMFPESSLDPLHS